jgi:O-antigen/teichoic acid export membrane protein
MSAATPVQHLTSGRLLARNSMWNLLGQLLPMAVGVVALGPLIHLLGIARFGLLSLAWVVVGYFSLFDLGIGRALTKLVADKIGANEENSVAPLAWTSLLLMALLGVFGGLVTWAVSPWLVYRLFKIPEALQIETMHSFFLLAASIPIVTATSGLRGILEGLQRFRILNFIRIPMSTFSFVGPFLVLPFSNSLVGVIGVLVAGRIIGGVIHLVACLHVMPALRHGVVVKRSLIMPLVKLGSWMTVSNVISPVMAYFDRFLIGALLSVSAVAYYTAPFDLVARLMVIPAAAVGVLFPAFSMSLQQDPKRTALLLSRGVKYVFLAVFPIVLVVASLAPEGLRLWLGAAFATHSTVVLRWLAAGVLVNCLAQLPFGLIQSAGRPDITAKLHLIEFPLYLLALRLLARAWGIEGVAVAWTARVTLEGVFLFLYASRLVPLRPRFVGKLGLAMVGGPLVLYLATLPETLVIKAAFLSLGLLVLGFVSWFQLTPEERAFAWAPVERPSDSAVRLN